MLPRRYRFLQTVAACTNVIHRHLRLQPETQKLKHLKANTLSVVNFGQLCSSLLGMTCQLIPAAKQRRPFTQRGAQPLAIH